jgi:seryl-tRNA synthetase
MNRAYVDNGQIYPENEAALVKNDLEANLQGLLKPTASSAVFARTGLFEQVVEGLAVLISRRRESGTEVLRFPPVMSRQMLEKSGYLHSFPHLLGCVSCLAGSESEIRKNVNSGDWTTGLAPTDLVLSPAACYPVYALQSERGQLPAAGLVFDVAAECFRHEATAELGRFQSFRMREYVYIGKPEQAIEFRAQWMPRAEQIANELRLPYQIAPASDPFFGKAGRIAAMSQIQRSLKYEMLIPVYSEAEPTACMSFNYHLDHFGSTWELRTDSGKVAHTACVAFGMDRMALAIFATHGIDPRKWPAAVRRHLSFEQPRQSGTTHAPEHLKRAR